MERKENGMIWKTPSSFTDDDWKLFLDASKNSKFLNYIYYRPLDIMISYACCAYSEYGFTCSGIQFANDGVRWNGLSIDNEYINNDVCLKHADNIVLESFCGGCSSLVEDIDIFSKMVFKVHLDGNQYSVDGKILLERGQTGHCGESIFIPYTTEIVKDILLMRNLINELFGKYYAVLWSRIWFLVDSRMLKSSPAVRRVVIDNYDDFEFEFDSGSIVSYRDHK